MHFYIRLSGQFLNEIYFKNLPFSSKIWSVMLYLKGKPLLYFNWARYQSDTAINNYFYISFKICDDTGTKSFLYFWINLMASTFNSDEFKHGRFDITTQQQKRKIRKGKVKPNQSSTIKLQLLALRLWTANQRLLVNRTCCLTKCRSASNRNLDVDEFVPLPFKICFLQKSAVQCRLSD